MSLLSLTLPQDGETIDASDVNGPFNAIASLLNGNLDDTNLSTISGSKITPGTLPFAAFTSAALIQLAQGWNTGSSSPTSVTYNGNRSYTLVVAGDQTSTYSSGMRIRTTRTVAAPTQSTSLNGTNQYWVKTSPNKLTFTDDFVVSAWVKLSSYSGTAQVITSRYNGTSGWIFFVNSDGSVRLQGINSGSGNVSTVASFQSLPLNKWVHVAVQLDMSAFTATSTTSYVMLDGVDVPASVSRIGTNPTTLVQAGNLEIGSANGGSLPFAGKIAQVAIFNAKVTQSTMQGYISQGLTGTETSLASAYSFNGAATDLNTTTPNDLTAQNSATATNADSPFGGQASGTISSTLDYGIVQSATFSTNTTLVVQVPEGCAIPTSGGVSAVSYSSTRAPYGFPGDVGKWTVLTLLKSAITTTSNAMYGPFASGGYRITVPAGRWKVGHLSGNVYNTTTTPVFFNISSTALTGLDAPTGANVSPYAFRVQSPSAGAVVTPYNMFNYEVLSNASTFTMYTLGSTAGAGIDSTSTTAYMYAENAYL